jgi:hypothetical protein
MYRLFGIINTKEESFRINITDNDPSDAYHHYTAKPNEIRVLIPEDDILHRKFKAESSPSPSPSSSPSSSSSSSSIFNPKQDYQKMLLSKSDMEWHLNNDPRFKTQDPNLGKTAPEHETVNDEDLPLIWKKVHKNVTARYAALAANRKNTSLDNLRDGCVIKQYQCHEVSATKKYMTYYRWPLLLAYVQGKPQEETAEYYKRSFRMLGLLRLVLCVEQYIAHWKFKDASVGSGGDDIGLLSSLGNDVIELSQHESDQDQGEAELDLNYPPPTPPKDQLLEEDEQDICDVFQTTHKNHSCTSSSINTLLPCLDDKDNENNDDHDDDKDDAQTTERGIAQKRRRLRRYSMNSPSRRPHMSSAKLRLPSSFQSGGGGGEERRLIHNDLRLPSQASTLFEPKSKSVQVMAPSSASRVSTPPLTSTPPSEMVPIFVDPRNLANLVVDQVSSELPLGLETPWLFTMIRQRQVKLHYYVTFPINGTVATSSTKTHNIQLQ